MVIVILGPYRSGTSLVSRLTADLGVDFGPADDLIPADERNPSGYFERAAINAVNHAYISSAGGTLEAPGEPVELLAQGDPACLWAADIKWLRGVPRAGIKDPRMCATLAAWFEYGLLDPASTLVVHVTRNLDTTVQSAIKHHHVANYAEHDPIRIRQMLKSYAAYARWQLNHLPVARIEIAYEALLDHPLENTQRIAHALGITQQRLIRRAAASVGRDRALTKLRIQQRLGEVRFRLGAWKNVLMGRRPPTA